ncbi:uncharacterized protein N7459_004796 [Penicillium hispanicum]|uniref:uncharacterized protein n=1 Tax=Penicillium hispanicum TaxID=1080232 RepID=UPI00254002C2|nr:uncharacterized protein N7459_004796 [Penicillium hispanicum]KAJ5584996.1 hypothetical protein N7459_004796 [Penicillium hispanicum]
MADRRKMASANAANKDPAKGKDTSTDATGKSRQSEQSQVPKDTSKKSVGNIKGPATGAKHRGPAAQIQKSSKKPKLSEEKVVDSSSDISSVPTDLDNDESPKGNQTKQAVGAKNPTQVARTSVAKGSKKRAATSSPTDEPVKGIARVKKTKSAATTETPTSGRKRKISETPTDTTAKKPRKAPARTPRTPRSGPTKAESSPASDSSGSWRGELNRSIVNEVYPQLQHYETEIEQTATMIKQADSLDKDLQTPEALMILKKLKERDELISQINEKKEKLSQGIYKEPAQIQKPLLNAYRTELGDEPRLPIVEDRFTAENIATPDLLIATENIAENLPENEKHRASVKAAGAERPSTLERPSPEIEHPVTPQEPDMCQVPTLECLPSEIHPLPLATDTETDNAPGLKPSLIEDTHIGIHQDELSADHLPSPAHLYFEGEKLTALEDQDIMDHVPTPGRPYSDDEEEEPLSPTKGMDTV